MSRALVPHMRVFDTMGSRCFCVPIGLYQFPSWPHSPSLILSTIGMSRPFHDFRLSSHGPGHITHHIPVVCPNDTRHCLRSMILCKAYIFPLWNVSGRRKQGPCPAHCGPLGRALHLVKSAHQTVIFASHCSKRQIEPNLCSGLHRLSGLLSSAREAL